MQSAQAERKRSSRAFQLPNHVKNSGASFYIWMEGDSKDKRVIYFEFRILVNFKIDFGTLKVTYTFVVYF